MADYMMCDTLQQVPSIKVIPLQTWPASNHPAGSCLSQDSFLSYRKADGAYMAACADDTGNDDMLLHVVSFVKTGCVDAQICHPEVNHGIQSAHCICC